jgi:hypothetical protein
MSFSSLIMPFFFPSIKDNPHQEFQATLEMLSEQLQETSYLGLTS